MNNLFNHKIFNIDYSSENNIQGKVALHFPASADADTNKATAIVQSILANELACGRLTHQGLQSVKITSLNEDNVSYLANGDAQADIHVPENVQADPLMRITSIIEESEILPIAPAAPSEIENEFLAILIQVWDLFVGALYYLFGVYRDKDLEHINSFSARFNQTGPESLVDIISIFRKSIDSSNDPGKFEPLVAQLEEAAETCKKIQNAANDSEKLLALSNELAQAIVAKHQETPNSENRVNHTTLDLGYYRDDVYCPQLFTFFTENGILKIRKVNMDPQLAELQANADKDLKRINPIQEFEFKADDPLQEKIGGLLNVLIPFQVKGEVIEGQKIKKTGVATMQLMKKVMDRQVLGQAGVSKVQKKETEEFAPPDVSEVVDETVLGFGAQKCQEVPEMLKKLEKKKAGDWWKQVFVAAQALCPQMELGKKEKIKWEMAYLQNYIDQVGKHTQGWQQLTFEEKKMHLNAVEKALEKLQKSYESSFKDKGAFAKAWETVDGENGFEAIKKQIEDLKLEILGQRMESLNNPSVSSSDWNAVMTVTVNETDAKAKTGIQEAKPGILTQNYQKIDALKKAIEEIAKLNKKNLLIVNVSENNLRQNALVAFNDLVVEAERVFSNGEFENILSLVPVILDLMPPPGGPEHLGINLWEGLTGNQIEELSEKLTSLVHHYWEAHLRTEKKNLDQMEAFAIANVRGIQIKLIREKVKYNDNNYFYDRDSTVLKAFAGFSCDINQINHLINRHPFHRSGFNAQREEKRLALEHFFKEGEGKGKTVSLDTMRPRRPYITNHVNQDDEFQNAVGSRIDIFKTTLERDQRGPDDILPGLLIDFRRMNIFSQCLMHPESTLHRSFNFTGMIGELERSRWLLEQFSKVVTDNSDDDDASKGLFAEEWKERKETIASMSSPIRLGVHDTSAEESGEACIKAYSGFSKLEFQPSGVMFNDNRDPFHDRATIGQNGNIPREFLDTSIGTKDEKIPEEGVRNSQRGREQRVKNFLTEVTAWLLEEYDPSMPKLDTTLNAKLRSLELSKPGKYNDNDSQDISVNSIYNVFDIIFNRPDILENEAVQRILELTLYRSGSLQKLIHANPEYFVMNEIGAKLAAGIQDAIHRDQKITASFLMQVSESLHGQITVAAEISRNKNYELAATLAPNIDWKHCSNDERTQMLEECAEGLSNINLKYSLDAKKQDDELSGLEILQNWANSHQTPPTVRKHLYITLLDSYMRSTSYPKRDLESLELSDWAHILQAYYFVKFSGEDAGNPIIHQDVERWFLSEALPYLTTEILTDQDQRNNLLTMHWQLSATGKAELTAAVPQWVSVNPYVFKIANKDVSTSVLNGVITVDNEPQGFDTIIPQSITKRDDYKTIFGNQTIKAKVIPMTDSGDVLDFHFTFGKKDNRKEFIIRQDISKDTVVIIQKINFQGTTGSYVFQNVKDGNLQGCAKLLQKYGFWQSMDQGILQRLRGRRHALCVASENVSDWDESKIIQFTLKMEGENKISVVNATTSDGSPIIQDPDKKVLEAFGFADGADAIIVENSGIFQRGIKEIRFLTKGLSLVNENGDWMAQGQLSGYKLIKDKLDGATKFGKDCHQFMLPLQKQTPSGAVEKKFLIWPVKLEANEKGGKKGLLDSAISPITETASGSDKPFLSVTVKEGAIYSEEGQLQGSSASFMYLAYSSLMQKRYEAALSYLEKAQQNPFNPEELNTFNAIAEYISKHEDNTKKGLAFRLKAELAVESIKKVQVGIREFSSDDWKKHLDKVKHQMKLYENYKNKIREEELSRNGLSPSIDPLHVLSVDERFNFERSISESVEFLVVNLEQAQNALNQPNSKPDVLKKLKEDDANIFIKEMIYQLKWCSTKTPIDELKSPYISKQAFYDLFLGFVNQIAEEKLNEGHWKIQKIKSLVFTGASIEELRALECGRQALLAVARKPDDQKIPVSQEIFDQIVMLQEVAAKDINLFSLLIIQLKAIYISIIKPILAGSNPVENVENILSEEAVAQGVKRYFGAFDFAANMVQAVANGNQEKENLEYATTIEKIMEELGNDNSKFSSEEKLLWDIGIEFIRDEGNKDSEQISLVKIIAGGLKYKINIVGMRHHAEKIQLINELEQNAAVKKEDGQYAPITFKADDPFLERARQWLEPLRESAFEALNVVQSTEKYNLLGENITRQFAVNEESELAAMEEEENTLRKNGVAEAVNARIEELKGSVGPAKVESLNAIKEGIDDLISKGKEHSQTMRRQILETVRGQRRILPELEVMLNRPWCYSEADVFDKVLELFQFGKLVPQNAPAESLQALTGLERDIAAFLISATQVQQLQLASSKGLEKLIKINEEGRKEISAKEWEITSKLMYKHLKAASNTRRYLDDAHSLENSNFTRKYLVTEYRLEVVLREDQNKTTKKMVEKPDRAILRPPGFGKSKAVIPPLLALLSEQGKFPVVLETEELCRIAQQDLDRMNRMIFSQARHIFRFHSSQSVEHAELADEYYRLLQAKNSGGYIVTSIESLAALDNTLVRLSKKLKENYTRLIDLSKGKGFSAVSNDKNFLEPVMSLLNTQKQRHWLMKMREVIHSGQFVADEVDDIFDINRWVNEAVDKHKPPSKKLSRGIEHIFETILSDPELELLGNALKQNQQANFNQDQIKESLALLAKIIHQQDTPFGLEAGEWAAITEKVSENDFVDFVCGKQVRIDLKWDDDNEENNTVLEYISILKRLITSTMPTVLPEVVDIDYGLNADGCTIEPLKNGEKLENTRHGNEYELIAYHYAFYASRVPSKEFFINEWQKIQTQITQGQASEAWTEWYKDAKVADLPPKKQVEELYKKLQKAESWKQRQLLLSDAGLERVRLFPKQIKCNVQDPLLDEELVLGGASGTVNYYALPEAFKKDKSVDSRAVSGDIDLSLAEMHQNGLDEEIITFNGQGRLSGQTTIFELARNLNCKAIINQGGALEGMNSKKVVRMIRKDLADKKINRQILFVDPETRRQMMWNPEDLHPKAYDPSKLLSDRIVYFGPPDTRGTDFDIPFGEAGFIVGKTMNEEQRQQAIMRLRQFGRGQTIRMFMHRSIQESLNVKLNRDPSHPITLGELINDVKRRSLERKSQSNWKSAKHKVEVPLLRTVKEQWFKPWIKDVNEYWKIDTKNFDTDAQRIFMGIAADVALYDAFSNFFVKERKPNFKADFAPVETVTAIKELDDAFGLEEKNAKDLAKDFEAVASGKKIMELLQPLSGSRKLPEDFGALGIGAMVKDLEEAMGPNKQRPKDKELLKIFVGALNTRPSAALGALIAELGYQNLMTGFKTFIVTRQIVEKYKLEQKTPVEFVEWLKSAKNEKMVIIPILVGKITKKMLLDLIDRMKKQDLDTPERLANIKLNLDAISGKIKAAREAFNKQEEETQFHSKNLRKEVAKSQDPDSNSQEQVQQQQQQQQMEQTLSKKGKAERAPSQYQWVNWLQDYLGTLGERSHAALADLYKFCNSERIHGHGIMQGVMCASDFNFAAGVLSRGTVNGVFDTNLFVSGNQLRLLQTRKILNGDTMDRLAVMQNRDGKFSFFLIDQQDQNHGFSPGINLMKSRERNDFSVHVYGIRSDLSNPDFGPVDYIEGNDPEMVNNKYPQFLNGLVQAKVMVGSIFFNEEEQEALNEWLENLSEAQLENLRNFICRIHSVDRLPQIRAWEKSPLAAYL